MGWLGQIVEAADTFEAALHTLLGDKVDTSDADRPNKYGKTLRE